MISIAINGACQTVVQITEKLFYSSINSGNTGKNRTFSKLQSWFSGKFRTSTYVPISRLGGHFVQGHINGVANIKSIIKRGQNQLIGINLDNDLLKFCIKEGSIAIDGVSLTIADIDGNQIFVSIIPHTLQQTTLAQLDLGDIVNIEVDMLAKYIYQFNSISNTKE